jgi:hypothetical protein
LVSFRFIPLSNITRTGSQNACDATTSEDGSTCVWCAVSTYGVCVSETIAAELKQAVPGIDCDDNGPSDDDATPPPPTPDADDDVAPNDDSVPSDYWNCIEKYSTSKDCIAKGCAWCDNKGGYGVCFDEDTAKKFNDSDWYSCTIPSFEIEIDALPNSLDLEDPSDPTCLAATIGGDESACTTTMDAEGKPCDWCSFQGYDVCMNVDQAQVVEQFGASCGDDRDRAVQKDEADETLADPSDTTCVAATVLGEPSCKGTMDSDDKPCDWCSWYGYDFCFNDDQAQAAEQFGASCGDDRVKDDEVAVADPSDPTCLAVTIEGSESSCKGTNDADGNPCDWCSFQGIEFCIDTDQAQIVQQIGASCNENIVKHDNISDPSDPTCLAATIGGDESACKATNDVEGNPCDWCSFQGYDFCVDADQAQIAEQYGVSCGDREVEISVSIA